MNKVKNTALERILATYMITYPFNKMISHQLMKDEFFNSCIERTYVFHK